MESMSALGRGLPGRPGDGYTLPSMTSRRQAAVVQLAIFVGGGIIGPVWHLAHHRPDHTHEADGRAMPFALGATEEPAHGHAHAPDVEAPTGRAAKARPHPHRHSHARAHTHVHLEGQEPAATTRGQVLNRALQAEHDSRPDPGHGHGSISHFGLALLGAPALLPVPAPAAGEWVLPVARTAALRLFLPSFPLPRPPPARGV